MNLGWKLAAVLQGWGGEDLLATYELERRPAALRNTAIARGFADGIGLYTPSAALERPGPDGEAARAAAGAYFLDHLQREFNIPGVTFGVRYDGSPVVCPGGEPPPDEINRYQPSGVPGGRAPHAWLDDGASLYDRFGMDFTLLEFNSIKHGFADAAHAMHVPLKTIAIEDKQIKELYGAALALIRPDQHIAWRGDARADAGAVLKRVTGKSA